jgi:hypothetical protein
MREYKSVKTQLDNLETVANVQAQEDWRICAVMLFRYLLAVGTSGLELTELVVIFECGTS